MAAPKYRLEARLRKEGRWEHFKHLRESIKPTLVQADMDISWAWRVASFAFQPPDGSPHEIERTPTIDNLLIATGIDPNAQIIVRLPGESTPDSADDDFYLDGDPEALSFQEPPEPAAPVVVLEPPPLPRSKSDENFVIYTKGLKKGAKELAVTAAGKRTAFEGLFESVDRKKRCKPYDMVQWVFEYAGINPAAIAPEEVPSAGALKYLQLIQENPAAYADFMKSLYAKTIPDKKQMEHEAKQRDDGRTQLRLLDAFDEEFESRSGVA